MVDAFAGGDLLRLVFTLLMIPVAAVGAWFAVTRRSAPRVVGLVIGGGALVLLVVLVLTSDQHGLVALLLVALVGLSAACARYALRRDRASVRAAEVPGTPVGPARHGVLIINPKSGGGKGEQFHLVDEARARGIEPILLEPGKDLLELAKDAIANGADVIGMAGGDGSQALVASVAIEHDVAHVCIPAGTRNHFALDLGLDRDDVVGALDAYGDAKERVIDLAVVNDRIFVNNASLGVYAKVVQSPEYRDAKAQTAASMLPELLGPGRVAVLDPLPGPDGAEHENAPLVLVSNNPYRLTRLSGFGTRARIDTGELGVTAVEIGSAADVAAFVAANAAGQINRFPGLPRLERAGVPGRVRRAGRDRGRRRGAGDGPPARVPLACRARCVSASPPTHRATHRPRSRPRRCGGRSRRCSARSPGDPPAIDEHLR